MQKQEVLILCGLPASGKTRMAEEWVAEDPENRRRINYDELRVELYGPDWRFNRVEEEKMKDLAVGYAGKYLRQGKSVVIDNTNLTPSARDRWVRLAKEYGITADTHEVSATLDECIQRDRLREKRVGRAVIERMALFHGFIDWNEYPRHHFEKDFVIVDIDGTLANGEHRKHYIRSFGCKCGAISKELCVIEGCGASAFKKDWDAFHDHVDRDTVIEPIAELVKQFDILGYYIIMCSGRWLDKGNETQGVSCGIKTEDWLEKHKIPYRHLFMRNGGDSREDSVIKQEILELLPKERIAWVLDDRDRVVSMWRRNGLTCLQVAEGAF